jgi:hypothetical protein
MITIVTDVTHKKSDDEKTFGLKICQIKNNGGDSTSGASDHFKLSKHP